MQKSVYKSWLIFGIGVVVIAAILFTLPINLFDGVIEYHNGLQNIELERNLSLSYFIGLGYEQSDMTGVTEFYLTTKGLILAIIVIVGIPGLIAYRVYIKNSLNKEETSE